MKRLALAVLAAAGFGCASPAPAPEMEDHEVLRRALHDVLSFEEIRGQKGTRIVLRLDSPAASGFLSEAQVRSDAKGIPDLSGELIDDLRRRNEGGHSWKGFVSGHELILLSADPIPDARLFIRAWRPGYSRNGNEAIVRFFFAPTPHGATGSYLLRKVDGRWTVVGRAAAYYA